MKEVSFLMKCTFEPNFQKDLQRKGKLMYVASNYCYANIRRWVNHQCDGNTLVDCLPMHQEHHLFPSKSDPSSREEPFLKKNDLCALISFPGFKSHIQWGMLNGTLHVTEDIIQFYLPNNCILEETQLREWENEKNQDYYCTLLQ